jgi:hypothetical protein
MSTSKGASDVLDAVFPPEIFPLIAETLVNSPIGRDAFGTLLKLICSNRQMYTLCLPVLMKTIHLSEHWGFSSDERVTRFANDFHGTGKLAHVKKLSVEDSINWGGHGRTLSALLDGMVNLENIYCYAMWRANLESARLLWRRMVSKPALPLRKIEFYTW